LRSFKPTTSVIILTTAMRLTTAPPELLQFLLIAIGALLKPSYAQPAPPNFIPIVSSGICALPPGFMSTDGCDEVCILAESCCGNWVSNNNYVSLQSRTNISCSSVNCGNVCSMACNRVAYTSESCNSVCSTPTFPAGAAYVFSRDGYCNPPFIDFSSPTHVGFGFQVAPEVYLFGSVENGKGYTLVWRGDDNGFWMTTGTLQEMMATFLNPSASGFHGALLAKPYNQYRYTIVEGPSVCNAVNTANGLYSSGYSALGNNCLDAVYNVLSDYGVNFHLLDPGTVWCPSGSNGWFSALPADEWSSPYTIPNVSSPVQASTGCPTTVASSCEPVQPTVRPPLSAPVRSATASVISENV
jgi:hypothetical protein